MGNVSRPLIGLLVATVAFFALWIVALKPSSSSSTGAPTSHALGAYSSAINRAKGVQAIVNHGAAAAGGTAGSTAKPKPASPPKSHAHVVAAATVVKPKVAAKPRTASTAEAKPTSSARPAAAPATAAQRVSFVEHALAEHKIVAALFYNPYAPDDLAVKQELKSIPTHKGQVVKLTVPLSELSNYTVITNQVPVAFSPTLVVINRGGQASTIVGFTDTFEIAQRIDGAL